MNEIILIKYGELTTKKDNRKYFLRVLKDNITKKLEGLEYTIEYDLSRMFVITNQIEEVTNILKEVSGIHEITICHKTDTSFESISTLLLKLIKEEEFTTFKVITKRSDKTYPITSEEVSRRLGGVVLSNIKNVRVDVHNPSLKVNVEIRRDASYIYFNGIKGLGGYPTSVQGKAIMMLSGGIDSPVAAYLSIKRGIKPIYLYFESIPHTSLDARRKVIKLAQILRKYSLDTKLLIVPFTQIQESIYKTNHHDYIITIMRRMMYRIAHKVALRNNAKAIINGENVGQVASQTLTSMLVVNEVTSFPIIRPLATYDKLETIQIAKDIETYETSILPYEDCCTVFVPEHPVINPTLEKAKEIESLIDFEPLIDYAIKNIIKIDIEKEEESQYL